MRRAINRLLRVDLAVAALALSATALGHSLQITNGFYSIPALKWLTAALGLAIFGTWASRSQESPSRRGTMIVTALLALAIAWQIEQLITARPGFYLSPTSRLAIFKLTIAAQALLIAIGLMKIGRVDRLWLPLVLAGALGTGVWMIKASPDPYIDVVEVHKEAIAALLDGKDPYRISFNNIYYNVDAEKFYNPETMIGGRIAIAYPYPPASLLLAVPGQVLFGDYRYAELLLLLAAAALIGYTQRGLIPKLAACLLITTPRVWFVIEQGWTEPVAIFTLALTVFLLVRVPVAAGLAGGLMVVTKQYLGFTGLALLRFVFMKPRQWFWIGGGAALTAAAAVLPFALWHPNAFMRNVVWLQTREPFRADSLSYLVWAVNNGFGRGTFVWAVGAAVGAALLSLALTRNTPTGFAASVSLTTFVMFAFGSKAFCNYYFFVVGAICATIAALPAPLDAALPLTAGGRIADVDVDRVT